MQLRGGFPISCFKWKNPGEGFKFKKKTQGGFSRGEGFSNCYTGSCIMNKCFTDAIS